MSATKKLTEKERESVRVSAERLDRDFREFVNYLRENDITLAKETGNIGKKDCFEINRKLTCMPEKWEKPTRLQPQYAQIDFFQFNCFYLGLYGLVKKKGGMGMKAESRLDKFMELSPVEKYCVFVAVYLGIYLEKMDSYMPFQVGQLFEAMKGLEAGKEVPNSMEGSGWFWTVSYSAAVRLNGLLDIAEIIWPEETGGEKKEYLRGGYRATGTGLCLAKLINISKASMQLEEDAVTFFLEQLKPLYGKKEAFAFFGESAENKNNRIFYLTAALANWECRLKMAGTCTLDDLHLAIQKAVDFDNDHLYLFEIGFGKMKTTFFHSNCNDAEYFADEAKLGELSLMEGQKFLYLFDFGDSWRFEVRVDRIAEEDTAAKITCLETIGKAPEQYCEEW